ncbi:MAG: cell surface protein SprA [Cytophagales bacterium]|nr:cell surface protein SprA [Cytophagales bacterium]
MSGDTAKTDSVKPYSPSFNSSFNPSYRFGDPFSNQTSRSPFVLPDPSNLDLQIEYDSGFQYTIFERIGNINFRPITTMSFREYDRYNNTQIAHDYWKEKSIGLDGESAVSGRRLIPKLYLSPAFDRIFGGSYVDITPTGFINLDFGGTWQNTDNPQVSIRQQRNGGFNFKQQISMNLVGKIGDKLEITANFDNNNTFDFENNMHIEYTGYDEEIIKKIEIGNVSMPVSNGLMTGAQTLFGLKTELQFGKMYFTGVASRQQGQLNSSTLGGSGGGIDTPDYGGSSNEENELRASNYDENKHFFLGHFFRDNYETWLKDPRNIISGLNISNIEVYITNTNNDTETTRNTVGFLDLGEKSRLLNTSFQISGGDIPTSNYSNQLYQTLINSGFRNSNQIFNDIQTLGLDPASEYVVTGTARQLEEGAEFVVNKQLGYITLLTNLSDNQSLAVAYQYTWDGQGPFTVGEMSSERRLKDDESIFLKLIRPNSIDPDLPTWDLMMKNIYNLRASSIDQANFKLRIKYKDDDSGIDNPSLHEGGAGIENEPLVELLGLDQYNQNLDPQPDGLFDYIPGATINADRGYLIFPVLEPFGTTLENLFLESTQLDAASKASLIDKYVFNEIYSNTQAIAGTISEKDKYRIAFAGAGRGGGSGSSGRSNVIDLEGFGVADGSVVVRMGSQKLQEGKHYTVDYNFGTVTITDQSLLNSGAEITASYETQDLFNFQTTWFYAARLDYRFNENFNVGATVLHLNERRGSTTRFNIGNEPLKNTKYGFDISLTEESNFLTKMVDAIPLVSTKEPSQITFNAEYAKFIPGTSNDLEGEPTSFIEDFETAASARPLGGGGPAWKMGATPETNTGKFFNQNVPIPGREFNFKKAKIAWYIVSNDFYTNTVNKPDNLSEEELSNHYVRAVPAQEIFKQRDNGQIVQPEAIFNLSYFPRERGQQNYTTDLTSDGELNNPTENWGGISRELEETNFNESNFQYIEFWLMDPFIDGERGRVLDGRENQNNITGGELIFNLGSVSEDLVPDGVFYFEQGMPEDGDPSESQINPDWGRTPGRQYLTPAFDNNPSSRRNQDIGFDGLRNDEEASFFSSYLNSLGAARDEVEADVSADDFIHFLDNSFDNADANIIERYKYYNGTDGNSPINSGQSFTPSNGIFPDKEDINEDNTISFLEEYFEYKIRLDKTDISDHQFVVDQVVDDSGEATWYQFRIPLEKFTNKYADPSFQSMRFMRMYLTGWEQPVVLRFTKFQLTSSTWRKHTTSLRDPALGEIPEPQLSDFEISVVNVEENSTGSPTQPPYVTPPGLQRDLDNSSTVSTRINEQSLQMCVEDLENGDGRAAFKTLTELDLINYDRIEMFLHAHAYKNDNPQDGDVNAFVRFSTDNTKHYYEIEIPLVMTPLGLSSGSGNERAIWPLENEINLEIDLLKAVKVERDRWNIDISIPYSKVIPDTNYKITVVGNPDLSDLQTLLIGVRNPDKGLEDDGLSKSVCIWANELRAVGYDTQKGWAANASLQTKLADLGQVDLNTRYSSIGYGGLNTTVAQRNRFESFAYQASARINLEKFMYPKKTGLVVPMFVNYEKERITPQYDPLNQDILLEESLKLFGTDKEKEDYKSLMESERVSRGINFSNVRKDKVKPDAKSRVYDVENFSFTYAYSDQTSNNHFTQSKFSKNVSGGVTYDYTPISVSWEPFSKGETFSSPYLQLVKDLNFSPFPTSFSVSALLDRQYSRTQFFNDDLTIDGIEPNFERLFTFNRLYNLRWNFFKSLNFDYTASANAVIDESEGIIIDDINTKDERKYVWNQIWNLGRMKSFDQNMTFAYKTPLDKLPFTNWLGADLKYAAGYKWTAGALNQTDANDNTFGNIIQNRRDRGVIGKIDMIKLYDKVTFLNSANASSTEDRTTGQGILRSLMALKSINVTYNFRETTSLAGFTPQAFLLGLDSGFHAPGIGFIFGDQNPNIRFKAAKNGWLTTSPFLTAPFLQTKGTDFAVRGTFQPIEDLSIQIDFTKSNTNGYQEIFRFVDGQGFQSLTPSLSGSYSISFLSIKTAFEKQGGDNFSNAFSAFEKNLDTMFNRLNDANPSTTPYDSLSQDVLIPAFLAAYSGKNVNNSKLKPFPKIPLPNWRVDYTGLIKIPAIAEIFSSFTISHGYQSTYTVGNFTNNLRYSDNLTLDHNTLNYQQATEVDTITNTLVPAYIINQVMISEQFVPLIGFNFRTKSNISTRIEFKKERNLSLNMSNAQVTETTNNDVTLDFGLTKTGFKVPFRFSGRTQTLPNDLTIRVSFTIRDSNTIQRKIERDGSVTNGSFNYQIRPTLSYNINRQLDLTMYFERTVTDPKIGTSYRRATTAFGFQLRFNLAQ